VNGSRGLIALLTLLDSQARSDLDSIRARLEQRGDEKALQAAQEELSVARAEVQDSRDAVGK